MKVTNPVSCVAQFAMVLVTISPLSMANDMRTVKDLLARPPKEYSSAPLWVWNDMLTEGQVRQSLRDLAAQGIRQAFVHPRPGLMTPYLGDQWFRLWQVALDQADKLGMNLWIYDENSYPSGFAGGWVPELMPESRGRGLYIRTIEGQPTWTEDTLAVFRIDQDGFVDVSDLARSGQLAADGTYMIAQVRRATDGGWYGGRCYVDLLYPGVTARFLEVTLEAYRRRLGHQFGKAIPGSFTDEPHIAPAGGLPWTEDLEQQFKRRWGYSLLASLPSLVRPLGDWQKVRHDYYCLLNELFVERWATPYYQWCQQHNIAFTGHYWEHEWPSCGNVPDNMAMMAWQQIPGIDCLMNQYQQGNNAQFGNVRMVKELASVANQLGRRRTLCEVYGASGWDLTFSDAKRIADWLAVLGVNLFDEHLSYVTIRGARKRDHPLSFSYHQPWWQSYHVHQAYITRLAAAMSQGRQVNRILVLEPTSTAWMYQGDQQGLDRLGKDFFDMLILLESAQVEYDLTDEYIMAAHGSVEGPELAIGQGRYEVFVMPPATENIESSTLRLLEAFMDAGGQVICCGQFPGRVDGAISQACQELASSGRWRQADPRELPKILAAVGNEDGFVIERDGQDKGILFHHRRQLPDGQLLLLVNTSSDYNASGTIECRLGGIEECDLYTGRIGPYPFEHAQGRIRARFDLPANGSLLLLLSKEYKEPDRSQARITATIQPAGPIQIRRLGPNVLTLDYVDVSAAGKARRGCYFYAAQQLIFQANGMDRNPWDSAVQFKDQIISKRFPPDSGFEATYRFEVVESVPKDLAIVIERPDLYAITCNGRPVRASKGKWWLDRSFGIIPIAKAARPGENTVTISCRPMTIFHELEPAYLIGSFTCLPSEKGFVVAPDQQLRLGRWDQQGMPFYGHGVSYKAEFCMPEKGTYKVSLPSWHGATAKVMVNGRTAGHITSLPWTCDVSKYIRKGKNTVEVIVFGTLKNTLGPHHGNVQRGSAWPSMFQRAPQTGPPAGKGYDTIGYGIFEPFVVNRYE